MQRRSTIPGVTATVDDVDISFNGATGGRAGDRLDAGRRHELDRLRRFTAVPVEVATGDDHADAGDADARRSSRSAATSATSRSAASSRSRTRKFSSQPHHRLARPERRRHCRRLGSDAAHRRADRRRPRDRRPAASASRVTDASLAIASIEAPTPTASGATDSRSWTAIEGSIGSASFTGVPGLVADGEPACRSQLNLASGSYTNGSTTTAASALDWTTALDLNSDGKFGQAADQLTVGNNPIDARRAR